MVHISLLPGGKGTGTLNFFSSPLVRVSSRPDPDLRLGVRPGVVRVACAVGGWLLLLRTMSLAALRLAQK